MNVFQKESFHLASSLLCLHEPLYYSAVKLRYSNSYARTQHSQHRHLCISQLNAPLLIISITTIPQYQKLATKKIVPKTVTIFGSFLFVYMRNNPIEM